jgi:thiamine-phosphate pyrophosphorylase
MLPLVKVGRAMSAISKDAPRLYLITPLIADASAFVAPFEAALRAGDIACVFLQVKAADPDGAQRIVRRLAPIAQRRGIACLVSDPQLAADTDADGVHIDGVGPRLEAALAAMQPGRIVGAGALETRDEAMQAGEAGVDYLMFGGPAEQQAFANVRERVVWWVEIFNPPCVAYAQTLEEVAELARARADFVALCSAVWEDPRGVAAALEAAGRMLAGAREPAA